VVGIRSLMIMHHMLRYAAGMLSTLGGMRESRDGTVRKQVSGACLRDLLLGSAPNQA
jgi:hypothetical protein